MNETKGWELLATSPVGVLSTIRPDGRPRPVPFVFAITADQRLITAIDHKPKSTRSLRRLNDIERDGRVSVLCHHYSEDWSTLWWVRVDGTAVVTKNPDRADVDCLASSYPQYRETPPEGPFIVIVPSRISGWEPG